MKVILFALVVLVGISQSLNPFSDEYIDNINNNIKPTWKAGHNFDENTDIESIKMLLGAKLRSNTETILPPLDEIEDDARLPETFDAREKWGKMCPTVSAVLDQSSCGSCWAFGAASAISDRTCIHSNGKFKMPLSPTDMLSCCSDCGYGCNGGFPQFAWDYWVTDGLVTGGDYNDTTTCWPYPFPKCEHHSTGKYPKCPESLYPTPGCESSCQKSYRKSFSADKHYGSISYVIPRKNLRKELFNNGPFETAFDVYADFPLYKSGVYQPTTQEYLGGHAVRVIGWGKENNIPYWLVANSWNEDWGDKGYFKILRDKNTCQFETNGVAGMPSTK